MQFRKPAAASACLISVGLLAAGCSSSGSSSSTSSPATTGTGSASASRTATQASAAGTAAAQAAGAPATCTVSVLKVALGTKTGTGDEQTTQAVVLTNKGSSSCTMDGFPGVNLVGTASGQKNYSWPLTRSSAKYSTVTLKSGDSAHFDLVYLPFAAGDGTELAVTKIVLTPPNTTSQANLTWSQPVLLQDAATHPGTWITPVTAGS
jgi:Protein of unknown function (DUF4232)